MTLCFPKAVIKTHQVFNSLEKLKQLVLPKLVVVLAVAVAADKLNKRQILM